VRFAVARPCSPGDCPYSESACEHPDPRVDVDVDVDELTALELEAFRAHGTDEQQAEILAWLAGELAPAEQLAGERDAFPELRP
jgi:hypothetical protein